MLCLEPLLRVLVALLEEPSTPDDDTVGIDKSDDATDSEIGLRSIRAVTSYIPSIETARSKITSEMETMVLTGLATLVRLIVDSCTVLHLNRTFYFVSLMTWSKFI